MRMDDKALKTAMKRMGIQSQEIEANEVIIRTGAKDLVIKSPQVTRVNMMGQEMFQVTGPVTERAAINKEDTGTVMEQANVDEKTAVKALETSKGDLAAAIMALTEDRK